MYYHQQDVLTYLQQQPDASYDAVIATHVSRDMTAVELSYMSISVCRSYVYILCCCCHQSCHQSCYVHSCVDDMLHMIMTCAVL